VAEVAVVEGTVDMVGLEEAEDWAEVVRDWVAARVREEAADWVAAATVWVAAVVPGGVGAVREAAVGIEAC